MRSRRIRMHVSLLVLFVPTHLVPYLLGVCMERWVSSRRMGKETHLKAHLSLMVLSRFGRRKLREKIICHLGGLLISMERNSVAALAQDNRPLVLP